MSGEITNSDRAELALVAVEAHNAVSAAELGPDDLETAVVDLLADLWHLADREVLDFDFMVDRARLHHAEEAAS